MIRRILILAVLSLYVGIIASPALATPIYPGYGTVYSYNPSFTSRITVLAQWIVGGFGHNVKTTYEYTQQNGCTQVWQQFWRGPVPVGPPTLYAEFCKP